MNSLPTGWMRSLLTVAATAISPMIWRSTPDPKSIAKPTDGIRKGRAGADWVMARSARARDKTAKKRTAVDRAKRPCNHRGRTHGVRGCDGDDEDARVTRRIKY